jgi:hypothetical protein
MRSANRVPPRPNPWLICVGRPGSMLPSRLGHVAQETTRTLGMPCAGRPVVAAMTLWVARSAERGPSEVLHCDRHEVSRRGHPRSCQPPSPRPPPQQHLDRRDPVPYRVRKPSRRGPSAEASRPSQALPADPGSWSSFHSHSGTMSPMPPLIMRREVASHPAEQRGYAHESTANDGAGSETEIGENEDESGGHGRAFVSARPAALLTGWNSIPSVAQAHRERIATHAAKASRGAVNGCSLLW